VNIGEDVSAHWLHSMTYKIPNTFYLYLSTSTVFLESGLMDQTYQTG